MAATTHAKYLRREAGLVRPTEGPKDPTETRRPHIQGVLRESEGYIPGDQVMRLADQNARWLDWQKLVPHNTNVDYNENVDGAENTYLMPQSITRRARLRKVQEILNHPMPGQKQQPKGPVRKLLGFLQF